MIGVFPTPVGMNLEVALPLDDINRVFPTPVGMNRRLARHRSLSRGVPHTRGDEPNSS